MNSRATRSWLTDEGPYAAFWISAAVAVACLIAGAIGLIRWTWLLLPVAGIFASLRALHLARQRDIRAAHEAEVDRVMERVQKRLQQSHPDGNITFEDYVRALNAEGVPGAERFAAEYPRSLPRPR